DDLGVYKDLARKVLGWDLTGPCAQGPDKKFRRCKRSKRTSARSLPPLPAHRFAQRAGSCPPQLRGTAARAGPLREGYERGGGSRRGRSLRSVLGKTSSYGAEHRLRVLEHHPILEPQHPDAERLQRPRPLGVVGRPLRREVYRPVQLYSELLS